MTILNSIALSNASLDAATAACWPAGTTHTERDVLVRGVPLSAVASVDGTPFVRVGQARTWHPRHRGTERPLTIVVTRVEHVDHLGLFQRPDVWVDAALGGRQIETVRVIGRPSAARRRRVRLLTEGAPGDIARLDIPADVHEGDLLAIACVGALPLSGVSRRSDRTPRKDAPPVPPVRTADDDLPFTGRCGR